MRPVNLILIGLALGCLICPAHTASAQAPVPSGTVITIAGNGVGGFSGDGGPATDASISGPYGSAIGPDGTLYFADNRQLPHPRRSTPSPASSRPSPATGTSATTPTTGRPPTPTWAVSLASRWTAPQRLYIGDFCQNWVSKVDLSTNLLTRYAGTGIFARLQRRRRTGHGRPSRSPTASPPMPRQPLLSDVINFRIRRVDPVTGIITTIAGNGDSVSAGDGGPATAASFASRPLVAADSAGNVFVVDARARTR